MPRTTLDIDGSVLREAKRLAHKSGRSLGSVVSELLALGLRSTHEGIRPPRLVWTSQAMRALIDLEDKDAVSRILDED